VPGIGGFLHGSLPVLANLFVGLVAGALVLGAVSAASRLRGRKARAARATS
jgi:hypothetical protein